ncbi:hypothetical protein Taro_012094, partial [Colocasia esculenta]|nr:hypothetical protein [Colocasia esculenta]
VRLPTDYAGCPDDKDRLPNYASCLGDRVRLSPSSITFPIPFSSRYMYVSNRGREPSSSGRGGVSASWMPAVLDFWRRYMFTRPEDLPRALVIWESTAQTNYRKSMREARDKSVKTIGTEDPTT